MISIALATGLATASSALAAPEPAAPATPAHLVVANRVIVEWEHGVVRPDKVEARADAEVRYQADLGNARFQLVGLEAGQTASDAIAALRADPAVAVAERDAFSAPSSIPNDPLFGQLWGLENLGTGIDGVANATPGADISAPGAWTRTVGTPSTVVADIDTGYRFGDPDLGPVAWENTGETPGNGVDDDNNGYVDDVHGYDFVGQNADSPEEDDDPTDDNIVSGGHGLHTAGTIGAAGDNGVGITGVAQDVRIMPLRVCSDSPDNNNQVVCPNSSIIAAINYAGANGARVANMSLGGTSVSVATLDALAENPQTLFVIAAGNDAVNNDFVPHYPCDYEPAATAVDGAIENIVCVAATDQADGLAGFSDWGEETVDLGAPGTEILSTFPAIEDLLGEGFEEADFEAKWSASGADGGFARTDEAPLTSFGMSDSPGAGPIANSVRESIMTTGVPVPSGYGGCTFSGRRFVSLGGGTLTQTIFSDGAAAFNSQPQNTAGSAMAGFATVPITGLAGTTVKVRYRYAAGPSPTESNGVWLDDLRLTCYKPLSAPLTYAFLQGTSMAAPHVSGTAALLFSLKPSASVTQVRDALLSSTDPDPSLAGITATGGRLDASKAIDTIEDPPPAPLLTGTDPPSPAEVVDPKIRGSAEAGTQIDVYAGPGCEGSPVAGGSAEELASPGIAVTVPIETVRQFSATATNSAQKTSACSAPISYTNDAKVVVVEPLGESPPTGGAPAATPPPPTVPVCMVPRLSGKTFAKATAALNRAGCRLGRVRRQRSAAGRPAAGLAVTAFSPPAGSIAGSGAVAVTLGPGRKNAHH